MYLRLKLSYFLGFLTGMALLCSVQVYAQGPNQGFDFPPVSPNDLQSTRHPKDSAASAAVLVHYGEAYFNSELDLIYKEKYRIKIYDPKGLKYGNVRISFYDKKGSDIRENIKDIVGYTYVLDNGKVTRVGMDVKNSSFEERVNEYGSVKKFSLPRVEPGSIIEYEYTMVKPAVGQISDWDFQEYDIPTEWSEFKIKMVPFYELVLEARGVEKFAIKDVKELPLKRSFRQVTFSEKEYRWAMKDIPAFKVEKYMTSPENFRSKMHFQLAKINYTNGTVKSFMETWPGLIKAVYEFPDFGRNVGSKQGKEEVEALIAGVNDPLAKAKKIYQAVSQEFSFNGEFWRYPDKDMKDLLKEKSGNVSSLNILLCNWLNLAGLEAFPVWLSTRDNGKLSLEYPFKDHFNYTLTYVKVGEEEFLLDPTDKWRPFGMLPYYCMNGIGLIMNKKKGDPRWARLEQKFIDKRKYSVTISPDSVNGGFKVDVKATMLSYTAYNERKSYQDNPQKYRKSFKFIDSAAENFEVKNQDNLDKPFSIRFTLSLPAQELGNLLYMQLPSLYEDFKENPFKAEKRTFPIDYGLRQDITHRVTFALPKGYQLEDMPKSVSKILSDKTVAFNRKSSFTESAGILQIYSRFQVATTEVKPDQYLALREMYTQMYDSFQEALVLKKVEN